MKTTRSNRPLDWIHSIYNGYGRLVIPVGDGMWLMWPKKSWSMVVVHIKNFHNCTATGQF